VFERPVRLEHGHALVPQEPGASIDVRAEAIAKYMVG
jgi:L-alanine-DL-glutamate epimerase-like enolase superfamily enzyme